MSSAGRHTFAGTCIDTLIKHYYLPGCNCSEGTNCIQRAAGSVTTRTLQFEGFVQLFGNNCGGE